MGQKLRAEQHGVFPGLPEKDRFYERDRVLKRELAKRAGLPSPERPPYENLGNRELPVHKKKAEIQKSIRDHQISMVEGPTGSGKSTQIVQYALEMGYKKIIYLEPRVLLADNLADQVQRELSEQLGDDEGETLIGVRHSERSTGRDKQIEIMTPATFMRVMDELEEFDDEPVLVVGDEIHEKDFETELAVAAAVKRLKGNPKWRLALASATLDSKPIHDAYSEINGRPIPLTSVEGRPHSLLEIEEPELTPAEAFAEYGRGHDKTMIFTTGKAEIRQTIREIQKQKIPYLRINKLHAKLSRADIKKATHAELNSGERQVIISTSAGQSGITVPGLTLVITDGTTRRPALDPDGTPGLFKEYCAQDELIQQGGRAGRDVAGGTVIYAKPADPAFEYVPMEERAKQAPAQIYHTNISRNVLLTASYGEDFYDLNKYLIHKVGQRTILEAYEVLYRLGALDELNNITEMGKAMNKFPLRPEFSRVIAGALKDGADSGTMQHLVGILSSIEAGGLPYFEKGVGTKWKDDIRTETTDDFIAQLDMFYATRQFYSHGDVDEAELEERNYDMKNTYRAHKTFDKIMRTLGLNYGSVDTVPPTLDQVEQIHDYLLAGMFDFAHKKMAAPGKVVQYASVHDRHEPTPRGLGNRGRYKGRDELIVGMPRAFEKKEKGVLTRHDVVENIFPTSLAKLTRHVMHVTERKSVTSAVVQGGHLHRTDELYFGTLKVDEVPSVSRLAHTPETKELLRNAAFDKPTQTIEELTSIKSDLERLVRVTPVNELSKYFPDGILTDEWLQEIIAEAIDNDIDNIYMLDNRLRTRMIYDSISIRTWISEAHEKELQERSPEYIQIGGDADYLLYYSHGRPIINGFNLKDSDLLSDDGLFLADGREVLINYRIGKDTKRHTAGEIKMYAAQLDD